MNPSMRLIIDGDGSVWSAYDEALVARWGYPDPDFDLPSFAVRNLGAVDVVVDADTVTLRLRWLTLKPDALAGAAQVLLRFNTHRVIVACEADGWTEQTFPAPEAAIEWLYAHSGQARGADARSIQTSPRQLKTLSDRSLSRVEESEDKLALLFKKWRLARGTFSADMVEMLVRFGLIDRTIIVTESSSDKSLVFEHVGAGFQLYEKSDSTWNMRAQGLRVTDQLDPEFGRWVDRTYRDVIEQSQPRFDFVDAVIQARGSEPYRWDYDRLLLPWHSGDGVRVVTGVSFNRSAGRSVQ